MTTYVLYSQDEDSDVEVLGVSESIENLQAHAAEFEKRITEETGETIEWLDFGREGDMRAEFHGMDYWIVSTSRV